MLLLLLRSWLDLASGLGSACKLVSVLVDIKSSWLLLFFFALLKSFPVLALVFMAHLSVQSISISPTLPFSVTFSYLPFVLQFLMVSQFCTSLFLFSIYPYICLRTEDFKDLLMSVAWKLAVSGPETAWGNTLHDGPCK